MKPKNEKLEQLKHECIMSEFDLAFVDQFKSFALANESDEAIKIECESQIGFIYSYHEMHEKAIAHLLPLMKKRKEIEDYHFSNLLLYTLKSLESLNRLHEAKALFDEFIGDQCVQNFYQMEAMLVWLVKALDPSEHELEVYDRELQQVMLDLGYHSEKATREEKILDIRTVHHKANRAYGEIAINYSSKPESEKISKLREFIASNPPGFYVKQAQAVIAKLEEK